MNRKLVAKHHPDKLRHKGMSESALKKAEEKMANINAAYNAILKKWHDNTTQHLSEKPKQNLGNHAHFFAE